MHTQLMIHTLTVGLFKGGPNAYVLLPPRCRLKETFGARGYGGQWGLYEAEIERGCGKSYCTFCFCRAINHDKMTSTHIKNTFSHKTVYVQVWSGCEVKHVVVAKDVLFLSCIILQPSLQLLHVIDISRVLRHLLNGDGLHKGEYEKLKNTKRETTKYRRVKVTTDWKIGRLYTINTLAYERLYSYKRLVATYCSGAGSSGRVLHLGKGPQGSFRRKRDDDTGGTHHSGSVLRGTITPWWRNHSFTSDWSNKPHCVECCPVWAYGNLKVHFTHY